jgi:hypothetical protein
MIHKKEDITIIERVIYLSKLIIALKLLKIQLNRTIEMARMINFEIKEGLELDSLKQVEKNITFSIKAQCSRIERLLKPLFESLDPDLFGYQDIEVWKVSEKELKQGYIRLSRSGNTDLKGPDDRYILFLSDYRDRLYNITAGEILPFNKVAAILGNQHPVSGLESLPSIYNCLLSRSTTIVNITKNEPKKRI